MLLRTNFWALCGVILLVPVASAQPNVLNKLKGQILRVEWFPGGVNPGGYRFILKENGNWEFETLNFGGAGKKKSGKLDANEAKVLCNRILAGLRMVRPQDRVRDFGLILSPCIRISVRGEKETVEALLSPRAPLSQALNKKILSLVKP
ncbi:MAG: hypothetical protein KatS3mg105_3199 [Gemmatales bacterium]|nr:MAG: hypothetical protein KatS3mg105_3199 [Gemmatales bacterium]